MATYTWISMWTRTRRLSTQSLYRRYICSNHVPTSMLSTLIGKKKITEAALARALTSGTIQAAESSFQEVLAHMRTCPHFITEPVISDGHDSPFILAVMTYNIAQIPLHFNSGQDKRVAQEVLHEFADSTSADFMSISLMVKDCKDMMKRLNRPSKNLYYGLARYIFHSYGLNAHQQPHFKELNAPNPLFLKEMDRMLEPLVWDWEMILHEFKLST